MQFEPLTLEQIPAVRPLLRDLCSRTCDFTIGGMFMWRKFFRMEYALQGGVFYSRLHDEAGNVYYNIPLGGDRREAVAALLAEVDDGTEPVRFTTVPETCLPAFPCRCRIEEQPDYADYLYLASDLAGLRGRKYSSQRNAISQFRRQNEDWSFQPVDPGNLEDIRDFFYAFRRNAGDGDTEREENHRVKEVLLNMEAYGMMGGVLRAGGRVTGFSLGEIVGDTLFVHIEKADRTCKGAYQMLVNQFVLRYAGEGILYVNREEDMGDPGLRAAKQAYHPVNLLKKYVVETGKACAAET